MQTTINIHVRAAFVAALSRLQWAWAHTPKLFLCGLGAIALGHCVYLFDLEVIGSVMTGFGYFAAVPWHRLRRPGDTRLLSSVLVGSLAIILFIGWNAGGSEYHRYIKATYPDRPDDADDSGACQTFTVKDASNTAMGTVTLRHRLVFNVVLGFSLPSDTDLRTFSVLSTQATADALLVQGMPLASLQNTAQDACGSDTDAFEQYQKRAVSDAALAAYRQTGPHPDAQRWIDAFFQWLETRYGLTAEPWSRPAKPSAPPSTTQ